MHINLTHATSPIKHSNDEEDVVCDDMPEHEVIE